MCTLMVGNQVLGPGTVVAAANRDEDPSRPSDSPGVLSERPHVVGGRDRRAGGTWLAVRERRAIVALLNRRPSPVPSGATTSPEEPPRSRGLLALEVACVEEGAGDLVTAAIAFAGRAVREARYAPFSLVLLTPDESWWIAHDGIGPPRVLAIPEGWHVVTHTDLDDPAESRASWLRRDLAGWTPGTPDDAARGAFARLALHAETGGVTRPAVCIHEQRMVTVSSSVVCLTHHEARYWHVEGRPCEQSPRDLSALLSGELAGVEPK